MEKEFDTDDDAREQLGQLILGSGAAEVLRLASLAIAMEASERAEKEAGERRTRVEHARWVHDHPWGNQI